MDLPIYITDIIRNSLKSRRSVLMGDLRFSAERVGVTLSAQ